MQEHKQWRCGFQARALAEYAQVQEETVFSRNNDAGSGGTFEPLDLLSISKACGKACTHDGLHPSAAALDATLQVLANLLANRTAALPWDDSCTHDKRFEAHPGSADPWAWTGK